MLAYQVRRDADGFGARWEQVPEPVAGPASVLVEVEAAALAWSDVLQSRGRYAGAVPEPPFTAGHEFAGVVLESASHSEFSRGDRVFGFLPVPGAFSERVATLPQYLRRTPEHLHSTAAAAVTTSFLTADVALVTVGRLTRGSVLVVHAAAGGVGRSAIQLARAYGVGQLIATAGSSARRADAVALGADIAVGYHEFAAVVHERTAGRGADIILESVGGAVFDASLRSMALMGRLITIGAASCEPPQRIKLPLLWQRSASVCGLHIGRLLADQPHVLQESWARIQPLFEQRLVDPGVAIVVAPNDIDVGIAALTARTVSGRVVIDFTRGPQPRMGGAA